MTKSWDASYRFLAAGHIRRQAKQLAEQLDGVRAAEDIECIHRARVASRRLRAALKMFSACFGGKTVKRWWKQIRRITREMGDARDKDVQIDFLCGSLAAIDDKRCFPGIARLLAKLERERELLQPKVSKAADRLAKRNTLDQMQSVTKTLLADKDRLEPGDYSDFTRRQTRGHVLCRMEKLLRHQDSLQNPCDQRRHHAMRIAAKRLRYTIELARPVYGQSLDEALAAVKRVQTLLGEVHDCDVWVERVDVFAKAERRRITMFFGGAGRFARLEPGIQCLRQERQVRRGQVFEELVAYWQELCGQDFGRNCRGGWMRRVAPAAGQCCLRTLAKCQCHPPKALARRRRRRTRLCRRRLSRRNRRSPPTTPRPDWSTANFPPSRCPNPTAGERPCRQLLRPPIPRPPAPPGADDCRHRRGRELDPHGHRRGAGGRPDRGARAAAAGGAPRARHLSPRPAGGRQHEGRGGRAPRLSAVAPPLPRRAGPRRRHHRRPRGQQRRHLPRPHLHGHRAERRGHRRQRGKPADRLRRLPGGGRCPGREPRRGADRRRRRRQHAVDPLARRRDRHLAELAAWLDPPSGNALHERRLAATLGGHAPLSHRQRADGAGRARCRCGMCGRSSPWAGTPASPPGRSAAPPTPKTW